ncbi:hypothetical protein [Caryophanon tenue]|uniref:DUF4352 domain-containing protein n=1 Tax=Caryophanon tenue TaxID=33978 RepID=A0A1C0YN22_9BACL|nr:hypothetical protein [Caryophanon tenue]OCS88568.1 hypothetical protein A6M13_01610 [Caryophanon tenue]
MKRWLGVTVLSSLLLAGCGEAEQALQSVYTANDAYEHTMEQVVVTMDHYEVQRINEPTDEQQALNIAAGSYIVEAALHVTNTGNTAVYYTPDVFLQIGDKQFVNETARLVGEGSNQSVEILSEQDKSFVVSFLIPAAVYEDAEQAMMQIPVPYTQPHTTSSGDALGDNGFWEIALK